MVNFSVAKGNFAVFVQFFFPWEMSFIGFPRHLSALSFLRALNKKSWRIGDGEIASLHHFPDATAPHGADTRQAQTAGTELLGSKLATGYLHDVVLSQGSKKAI